MSLKATQDVDKMVDENIVVEALAEATKSHWDKKQDDTTPSSST